MTRPRNVLVFPAGTEVGLEIHQALKDCKEVILHGASMPVSNHAPYVFERYHELPGINEQNWLPALQKLCHALSIDYIFPAYDDVIVALTQHADEIPAVILTATASTCEIARSKSKTYAHLKNVVRVPRCYSAQGPGEFPLFVKPDRGQGSQGAQVVHDPTQLSAVLQSTKDVVISEYLPGEEFTVDCFSDRDFGVLFCGARVRVRMRNGIAVSTHTVQLPDVLPMAQEIHHALGMRGAWFFQVKRAKDGGLVLLEVAPRIAGSMSAHRVQGVNFPLLSIYEHERKPLGILTLPTEVMLDRALKNRYQVRLRCSALYIDLDDTLLLREKINLDALQLVFKFINQGLPVFLVTRHAGDLSLTLQRHRLDGIFDGIFHLKNGESKSTCISHADAIFVDDSFSERAMVHHALGIPTFDCSMIEALLASDATSLSIAPV